MAEPVRVLHVITRLVLGGAQENTLLTLRLLDRDRYHLTLASGPSTGPEGSLEDEVPSDVTHCRIGELVRYPHPTKDLIALNRLYRLMAEGRYDIVHTHTTKAGILGRVAAHLARVPVVIHTPHGHAFHDYLSRTGSAALIACERWMARWTDRIICLTEAERRDHLRYRIGPAQKFTVIHSGVELERFRAAGVDPVAKRRSLGLSITGPLIGCVARLVPVKGVAHLLEAVARLRERRPDATLVLIGDGPLRGDLERQARQLNLNGAVAFLGLRRDVAEIMPLFDVVVMPSLNEGMGKALVEAMAAARPVVGSRISGIQDIITDGVTGLLVPPADPGALAQAMAYCLEHRAEVAEMARRAQQNLEDFGVAPMVRKIDALYQQLLPR